MNYAALITEMSLIKLQIFCKINILKYLNGAEIVLSGGSDEPKINTITEEVLHELLLISAPVAFHNTYISHSFLIIS